MRKAGPQPRNALETHRVLQQTFMQLANLAIAELNKEQGALLSTLYYSHNYSSIIAGFGIGSLVNTLSLVRESEQRDRHTVPGSRVRLRRSGSLRASGDGDVAGICWVFPLPL